MRRESSEKCGATVRRRCTSSQDDRAPVARVVVANPLQIAGLLPNPYRDIHRLKPRRVAQPDDVDHPSVIHPRRCLIRARGMRAKCRCTSGWGGVRRASAHDQEQTLSRDSRCQSAGRTAAVESARNSGHYGPGSFGLSNGPSSTSLRGVDVDQPDSALVSTTVPVGFTSSLIAVQRNV